MIECDPSIALDEKMARSLISSYLYSHRISGKARRERKRYASQMERDQNDSSFNGFLGNPCKRHAVWKRVDRW